MKEIFADGENYIVSRRNGVTFCYDGWPSVCRRGDRLYAAFSGFRMGHVCPFGKTALCTSDDGGRTWSAPRIVSDTDFDDRDAGIIAFGEKREKMLVTWFINHRSIYENSISEAIRRDYPPHHAKLCLDRIDYFQSLPEEEALAGSFCRISDNGGECFGEMIKVPVSAPHGPAVDKNGGLMYLGKEMNHAHLGLDPLGKGEIGFYVSADGVNWAYRGKVPLPENCKPANMHEPHVVELDNGELFGAIRVQGTDSFGGDITVYTTRSADGGRTWSVAEPTGLRGTPPHLLKHSSGALILSYARRSGEVSERAAVSFDGGRTWEWDYILDARQSIPDLGYPASVELDDGSIYTLYYQMYVDENGISDPGTSILATRWTL